MMRRLIFLLLIFASLTGFSQIRRELQYYSSLCETIPFNNVKFWSSGMSSNKADYWYSLNASPIQSVFDVIKEDIYPIIILKDLKLKPDTNFLRIYYREGSSYKQFNDTLYFIHPKLRINEIKQGNIRKYLTDGYYLIQKDLEVSIDFEASFGDQATNKKPVFKCNSNESEKITQIDYKFNEDPWLPAPAPGGIFKISTFRPGLNSLVFRYKTAVSENYPKDTIEFFRTWFELDPLFNSAGEIWKKDTIIRLKGFPAGGWFTGNGIEGNSAYFNPAKAGTGKHLLTYHFPFRGKDLTTSDTVRVLAYDFTVTGPQSVCANSSDVIYTIGNCNSEFSYTWNITGGSLTYAANCSGVVKWNDQSGVGIIKVTAIHKVTRYSVDKYLSVYKTSNKAYNIPSIFFGDADNRLVISSFTEAFEYRWIPDGQNPVVTKSHFYYFNAPIKSNITLILKTENGCESSASINLPNKSSLAISHEGESQSATVRKAESLVFPNPARDHIFISLKGESGELKNMFIYDAKSNLVLSKDLRNSKGQEVLRIDVSGFVNGLYFTVIEGSAGNVQEKFIVTK